MKYDGRHEARLVVDGNLTDTHFLRKFSGVVCLKGIRLVQSIAGLNVLEFWSQGLRKTYSEAKTKEKTCDIAGSEFGYLKDYILIITNDLHRLRTSGLYWHESLAN